MNILIPLFFLSDSIATKEKRNSKVQKIQLVQLTENLREGKPEAEEDAKLEEEVPEDQGWRTNNQ